MHVKHFFKMLIILLLSSATHAASHSITAQALLTQLQDQQAPIILDVRSAQEYQQGHIKGAINITYDQLYKQHQLTSYKNKKIVIYCHSGRRAAHAYQTLQRQGFTDLIDLKGHMILWRQLNYPLVSTQ